MNQHARWKPPIPFIDVAAQRRRLGRAIDDAVTRVLNHCQFVQGPEVRELEADLAAFCGARHAIGCASGTDALLLVLMAWQIGPGDAVICPSFTFCATAEMVALLGATPMIADVDADDLQPRSGKLRARRRRRQAPRPEAARHDPGRSVRPAGGSRRDRGDRAEPTTVRAGRCGAGVRRHLSRQEARRAPDRDRDQFFPAKPLGCYGDGGAVFTDDDALAARIRSLRVHGEGVDRYDGVRIGITGRLDTIQAAVLIEKLKIFPDEIAARNRVAARYAQALADVATCPGRQRNDFGLGAVHDPAETRHSATASPPP